MRLSRLGLRLLSSAIAAACLVGLSAHAATVVESTTAPSENIVAGSSAVGSGNTEFADVASATTYGGVSFKLAEASSISAVTFYVGTAPGAGALSADVSLSLVSFSEFTSSSIAYTTLHTEQMTTPASLSADNYLTFGFSEPVSLAAGNYGIVFQWVTEAGARKITFRNASTDGADSKTFKITDGTPDTYLLADRELFFSVQGGASQIPEPSVYVLCLGGVFLIWAVWSRRGRGKRRE